MTLYEKYKQDVAIKQAEMAGLKADLNQICDAFTQAQKACPHNRCTVRTSLMGGYLECQECGFGGIGGPVY